MLDGAITCVNGFATYLHNVLISGIRMLDGDVTDAVEGLSLSIRRNFVDIYSASWGPEDNGATVDGPGRIAMAAFRAGIKRVSLLF